MSSTHRHTLTHTHMIDYQGICDNEGFLSDRDERKTMGQSFTCTHARTHTHFRGMQSDRLQQQQVSKVKSVKSLD